MGELIGVLAAACTTVLGGISVGVTRLVIDTIDPVTLGAFRFGIGCVLLTPFALSHLDRWRRGNDRIGVAALGLLYFCLYPILFNASLAFTVHSPCAVAVPLDLGDGVKTGTQLGIFRSARRIVHQHKRNRRSAAQSCRA